MHCNTITHGPFLWNRQRQQGRILRWSGARPAVPLFFQTAPPWWSLLLLHSNISFLLRTCSHILPSFFEGTWVKYVTYLHLPLEDISRKDSIYLIVVTNNYTSKYYSPIWKWHYIFSFLSLCIFSYIYQVYFCKNVANLRFQNREIRHCGGVPSDLNQGSLS